MTSWDNLDYENGGYIQWIAYSALTNVQEMRLGYNEGDAQTDS